MQKKEAAPMFPEDEEELQSSKVDAFGGLMTSIFTICKELASSQVNKLCCSFRLPAH